MCNSDRLVIQESEGFRLVSGNAEIQECSDFALTVMPRDSGRDGDGPCCSGRALDPDGPDQADRDEANCGAAAGRREAASNFGDGLLALGGSTQHLGLRSPAVAVALTLARYLWRILRATDKEGRSRLIVDEQSSGRFDCCLDINEWRRVVSSPACGPPLPVSSILAWADAHHERHETWPTIASGPIPEAPGETWVGVEIALRSGSRGLPRGMNLRRLFEQQRGARFRRRTPPFTVERILGWADAHHARTGNWPLRQSGSIPESPHDNWKIVDIALLSGWRGLPGGSSLARVLAVHRAVRNRRCLPDLTIPQILGWAEAFLARFGRWPDINSGPIDEAPGETWVRIGQALRFGQRGLFGRSSLGRLFRRKYRSRSRYRTRRLSIPGILAWADAHRERHGSWPTRSSGPIREAPAETWISVCQSLSAGHRGLPGGTTLARLLHVERNSPRIRTFVPFTEAGILAWADAHHARTGAWPRSSSGVILESPADTWMKVYAALRNGGRGLPGGSSIANLLAERRGCHQPRTTPRPTRRTARPAGLKRADKRSSTVTE